MEAVGPVWELAEQEPIHKLPAIIYEDEDTGEEVVILTAVKNFYNSSNNFSLHFNESGIGGQVYRGQAHSRRFQALFPELDQLLIEKRRRFREARKKAATEGIFNTEMSFMNVAYRWPTPLCRSWLMKTMIPAAEKQSENHTIDISCSQHSSNLY